VALSQLRDYLGACGGAPDLLSGWKWVCEERKSGNSAGTVDGYFYDAAGKRFRSRLEVVRRFGLVPMSTTEYREHVGHQKFREQARHKKARRPG
jgi:hypothetical protein